MEHDLFVIFKDIEDHSNNKKFFLNLFDDLNSKRPASSGHNISHTDYFDHRNNSKNCVYLDKFYQLVKPFIEQVTNSHLCRYHDFQGCWYQQYYQGSHFSSHTHPNSHFAGIYYVELPGQQAATKFVGYEDLDLNEGDVIIFPSYIPHHSPANPFVERKTVISFNFNINY